MTKDFSDAPLTVDGITVKPTWPWSKEYRKEVADGMRKSAKSDISPEEITRRYIEWYAHEHGLTLQRARQKIEGAP